MVGLFGYSIMGVDQDKVDKIRAFADRGRNLEKQYGDSPLSLDAIQHYNRRLDDTIQSLQDHVKRQEDALRKASHMASNYIKGFITNVDIATCVEARTGDLWSRNRACRETGTGSTSQEGI